LQIVDESLDSDDAFLTAFTENTLRGQCIPRLRAQNYINDAAFRVSTFSRDIRKSAVSRESIYENCLRQCTAYFKEQQYTL